MRINKLSEGLGQSRGELSNARAFGNFSNEFRFTAIGNLDTQIIYKRHRLRQPVR